MFDGTGLPKRRSHSVGMSHQDCGALGKRANCQVTVTLHYCGPRGHFPLALRLHLPESWTDAPARLNAAGVPDAFSAHRTKDAIAMELLDQTRAEGIVGGTVVADLGYGDALVRAGLTERGWRYVVGVQADCLVFPQKPSWVHPPRIG